jgi:hypothetical protein
MARDNRQARRAAMQANAAPPQPREVPAHAVTETEFELADVAAPQEEKEMAKAEVVVDLPPPRTHVAAAEVVAHAVDKAVDKAVVEPVAEAVAEAVKAVDEVKKVKISLPRSIKLLLENKKSLELKAGIHEVSEEVASHWYVKAAGGGRV